MLTYGGIKVLLAEFAFPDGDDGPGEGVEAMGVEFVTGDVAGYLFFPESGVRLGLTYLVQPRWPCQNRSRNCLTSSSISMNSRTNGMRTFQVHSQVVNSSFVYFKPQLLDLHCLEENCQSPPKS